MKLSTYSNPHYCLSFGNDTVFLDIVVDIIEVNQLGKEFRIVIKKAQLDGSQEAFPLFLCGLLQTEALVAVQARIDELLLAELTPVAFSLFYDGQLDPTTTNDTDTTAFTD